MFGSGRRAQLHGLSIELRINFAGRPSRAVRRLSQTAAIVIAIAAVGMLGAIGPEQAAASYSGTVPIEPHLAMLRASGDAKLSQGSKSHWAHPSKRAPIRREPRPGAKRIVPIHFETEDGFPEVYPALRQWTDKKDRTWIRVRIPMRPNGRTGWVRRFALGPLYFVNTKIIVNRSRARAVLYNRGNRIWKAPVGTGAPGTPTPPGRHWIREKFRNADPGGLYGPFAFGTSDYSVLTDWPGGGVIGIHGTDEPGLIPGRPSHGCIRVRNRALRRLWHLLPIGTPLLIR